MVRVLFTDVYFDDGEGAVRGPGYIHLRDGSVVGYGEGEPPEELALAELVISSELMIVLPGPATVLTAIELYPFRGILGGRLQPEELLWGKGGCVGDVLREVRGDAAYWASLMGFYQLAVMGVSRVYALSFNPGEVYRALRDSGLSGAVIVPRGCGVEVEGEAPEMLPLHCGGGALGEGLRLVEGRLCSADTCFSVGEPPVHVEPWVSPWHIMVEHGSKGYRAYTVEAYRIDNPSYRPLSGKAHLVAVDASEPPGWVPSPRALKPWALGSLVRVETLVSGGSIVVDGGEHLLLGRDAARRAAEKLGDTVERLLERCQAGSSG